MLRIQVFTILKTSPRPRKEATLGTHQFYPSQGLLLILGSTRPGEVRKEKEDLKLLVIYSQVLVDPVTLTLAPCGLVMVATLSLPFFNRDASAPPPPPPVVTWPTAEDLNPWVSSTVRPQPTNLSVIVLPLFGNLVFYLCLVYPWVGLLVRHFASLLQFGKRKPCPLPPWRGIKIEAQTANTFLVPRRVGTLLTAPIALLYRRNCRREVDLLTHRRNIMIPLPQPWTFLPPPILSFYLTRLNPSKSN